MKVVGGERKMGFRLWKSFVVVGGIHPIWGVTGYRFRKTRRRRKKGGQRWAKSTRLETDGKKKKKEIEDQDGASVGKKPGSHATDKKRREADLGAGKVSRQPNQLGEGKNSADGTIRVQEKGINGKNRPHRPSTFNRKKWDHVKGWGGDKKQKGYKLFVGKKKGGKKQGPSDK